MTVLALLAQSQPAGPQPSMGGAWFIGLLLMMFVFMFVLQRGSRKSEEKKRRALLDAIKKNDRVMTHSGIIGTVVTIKDHEVVLKVDESTNTKITFLKDAIRQVVTDAADADRPAT